MPGRQSRPGRPCRALTSLAPLPWSARRCATGDQSDTASPELPGLSRALYASARPPKHADPNGHTCGFRFVVENVGCRDDGGTVTLTRLSRWCYRHRRRVVVLWVVGFVVLNVVGG